LVLFLWAQVGEGNASIFTSKIKSLRDMIQEGLSVETGIQVTIFVPRELNFFLGASVATVVEL
jgi:hypothetical protein